MKSPYWIFLFFAPLSSRLNLPPTALYSLMGAVSLVVAVLTYLPDPPGPRRRLPSRGSRPTEGADQEELGDTEADP